MGRIVIRENPLDLREEQTFLHSGPLIEFLLERFPNGLGRPHVALLGAKRLPVEDYDTPVQDDDVVTLLVAPAGIETLITAVIGAIVSYALNWAINRFFGDASAATSPSYLTGSLPAANSVYTLSTPSNVARLGQVIPVLYGRNPAVPDLASQPYQYFENNEMYVVLLLCLGQGYFEIEDIQISDSSIYTMAAGVIEAYAFAPDDHWQTFGVIQQATGWYENVYTSIEVADQELTADTAGSFVSTAAMWNGEWAGYYGAIFWLHQGQATTYVSAIRNGQAVYAVVTGSAGNDGTYQVGFIWGAGDKTDQSAEEYGRKGILTLGTSWPLASDNGTIRLTLVHPDSDEDGVAIGPYNACPEGIVTEFLSYDIVFPNGCYQVDNAGALYWEHMTIEFYAEPIDDDGVPTGPALTYSYEEWFATNTPQRRTFWHSVPPARYRVRAYRTSPKSDQASDVSTVYWTGLKAILGNTTPSAGLVYGNVTLIALKAKATQGLASDAVNHVTVKCTRTLEGVATRNPGHAFKDIFTNMVYGGRRSIAELDLPTIDALTTQWDGAGQHFDAIFDQQSNVWEAMNLSIQMQRAAAATNGGVVTIIEDKNYLIASLLLTEDTIKSIALSYLFSTLDDYDGVEGEYRSEFNNDELYTQWPLTADNPESVTLWGCRDEAQAEAYVKRRWAQLVYRRRLITLEVELEGHVILVGEAIEVQHRLLGVDPVMCIVTSVEPKEEFAITIECFRHQPEVFAA